MKKLMLLFIVILLFNTNVNAVSDNISFYDDFLDFFKNLFSPNIKLSPGDLTCEDISNPNCIELIPGQSGTHYTYNSEHDIYILDDTDDDDYYFLLMGDMSCDKSCIIPRWGQRRGQQYTTTIDLNEYTLTYSDANYETLPNTGFEEWDENQPIGWNVISGNVEPRSTDYYMPMSGDWVLYTDDSLVIESSLINLSLSDREYMAYVTLGRASSSDIVLEVLDSNDSVVCSETDQGYFRGKSIGCEFTPNSFGQHKLRITTSNYAYIDVTGIVPINDYGIVTGSTYNLNGRIGNNYPGLSFSGSWDDVDLGQYDDVRPILEVKNGNIRGGSENIVSYALRTSAAPIAYFHDLDIRVKGLQSHTIRSGGRIINNYLEVDMPWYFARENSIEENMIASGEIINNTLIGGQGVIRLGGTGTIIDGNFISNNAQATNHYAIIHDGAENPIIRNNIFDPIEGSGILTYVGHGYRIYNNTFYVNTATCNVEYINEDYSTNGIRMNDYGAETNYDNWIYDNLFHITGTSYNTYWSDCQPVTTGIFYSASGVNNRIFGNEFYINDTNEDNSQPVIGIYAGATDDGVIKAYNNPSDNRLIYNNYFETNDKAVWISTYYGGMINMWLENNTFTKILNEYYTPSSENAALRFGRLSDMVNTRLINNKYLDGFDSDEYYFSGINGDYDLIKKHYLHVYVKDSSEVPIQNAFVRVLPQENGSEINGYTDNNGYVRLDLIEYTESGTLSSGGSHNRVMNAPYDVYVSSIYYTQVNGVSENTINIIGSEVTEFCGDEIIQSPNDDGVNEICDGNNFGGLACSDYEYDSGDLSCINCLTID
ncbi:hypothetical protein HN706_01820, partial [Candidatus Woesearchaeota archaeon]|nr:hypothetical protein [Candidatus Woesearchaeota archaeon]MBT7474659.1 hypothetical protein [Candidatus Woesearchaeota archaeon]